MFHAQIDGEDQEGSLSSTIIALPNELNVHDFRATLGNAQYRVVAIEDPFPLLLIPVVVGICAMAANARQQHKVKMNNFRDLALDCMNKGGTPTIIDKSGSSMTFDGRVNVKFGTDSSFTCVMPQKNQ